MKSALWIALFVGLHVSPALAQKRAAKPARGLIVVFIDTYRLAGREQEADNFRFYFGKIREIAERDFPDIELKFLERGEMVALPDRTRFNSTNARIPFGFVLSARGKKRLERYGAQTETDFACAAASFFRRASPACPRNPGKTG